MLRLDHPMTQHVFQASGLMDAVMVRGQKMSVSPSAVRTELLIGCLSRFTEMRELARAHFGERAAYILTVVDEYEAAIRALAGLAGGQITGDRRDGAGTCSVCETPITHYPEHDIVLCSECDNPFMAAYSKLDSSAGFGTWAI